jgi:hypothetical protein
MRLGKMFKDAVRDIMRWANSDDHCVSNEPPSSLKSAYPVGISSGSSSTTDSAREMHFTITNATGGKIVKVSWYDYKLSREYVNLHIITDQEDLAEELALIITRESIQR